MTEEDKPIEASSDKTPEKKQEAETKVSEAQEPLPIWFFVGLILLVYGLLVLAAGFLYTQSNTVLASTRPGLWWGAIIVVGGAAFLGIGLKVHRDTAGKGKAK